MSWLNLSALSAVLSVHMFHMSPANRTPGRLRMPMLAMAKPAAFWRMDRLFSATKEKVTKAPLLTAGMTTSWPQTVTNPRSSSRHRVARVAPDASGTPTRTASSRSFSTSSAGASWMAMQVSSTNVRLNCSSLNSASTWRRRSFIFL